MLGWAPLAADSDAMTAVAAPLVVRYVILSSECGASGKNGRAYHDVPETLACGHFTTSILHNTERAFAFQAHK
jgi:hypothetical protein